MLKPPRELIAAIRKARSVLIATHSPMDGDGMGCGLALLRVLGAMGKECHFVTEAYIPRAYAFLPGYVSIQRVSAGDPLPACDLILGLDAGEADRLGRVYAERPEGARVANIDHHVSNSGYGDIAWVEAGAAATGEQALALIQALGVEIDTETALCLFVAIVTDTGRFCYSSTTPATLEAAAELVRLGADPDLLQRKLFGAVPLPVLHLHARAVDRLEFSADGRVCILTIPHDYGADLAVDEDAVKDLVDTVIGVKGVVVGALVRGLKDGTCKVSLRSKSDAADVAALASSHGGGGHVRAAGFTGSAGPEATAQALFPELEGLAVAAGG
ncbi:MAG: DHH family phosphoesterase [Planctomycetota bacterium]